MGRRACVIVLLDGLGDRSFESLGNKTPLQAARTPNLDRLARDGACGLFHATQLGRALPSEDAHFALFGYSPEEFPGRGPLEALGASIPLATDDVAILAHLACVQATDKGRILVDGNLKVSPETADALFATLQGHEVDGLRFRLVRTHGVQGILIVGGGASPFVTDTDPIRPGWPLIEPRAWARHASDPDARRTARALKSFLRFSQSALAAHPANRARTESGEPPANTVVTQRSGRLRTVPTFRERFGLRGLTIASGIILPGLAAYVGMDCRRVADTDQPDNDLAERIALAQRHLHDYDFIHVHTKLPDEAGHSKDPLNKVRAIEACDRGIGAAIDPLERDPDVVLVVTADHSTPSGGNLIHSGEPVPLLIHGTGLRRDSVKRFDEIAVARGALSLVRGRELMYLVLNYLDRAKLQGLMDTPDDQPYWPGDYQPFSADEP